MTRPQTMPETSDRIWSSDHRSAPYLLNLTRKEAVERQLQAIEAESANQSGENVVRHPQEVDRGNPFHFRAASAIGDQVRPADALDQGNDLAGSTPVIPVQGGGAQSPWSSCPRKPQKMCVSVDRAPDKDCGCRTHRRIHALRQSRPA